MKKKWTETYGIQLAILAMGLFGAIALAFKTL